MITEPFVLHFLVSFLLVVFISYSLRDIPGACLIAFMFVIAVGLGKESIDWVVNRWHMSDSALLLDCILDMTFNVIGAILGLWCSKELE